MTKRGRPRKLKLDIPSASKGKKRGQYNLKEVDQRGKTYKEPNVLKNFWKENSMDKIIAMTDQEIYNEIDRYLEAFIFRQTRQSKTWDFPITKDMLSIDPNWKK